MRHEQNGFAVPCDRPDALIAAGVRLATDAALRARLRAASRVSVEPQSWENVIVRFESDLAEIAGTRPAALEPALA